MICHTQNSLTSPPDFGTNLRQQRQHAGITTKQAAQAAHVHEQTWRGWELGKRIPKLLRVPSIAQALGIPVLALFQPFVVAEVVLSLDTISAVRRAGRDESKLAAERLAAALEPLIYRMATGRTPKLSHDGRARPRRTREQVLAGITEANKMRQAKALRLQQQTGEGAGGGEQQIGDITSM